MFASRWHSPPKPVDGLQLRHGHVQRGEPVGVERALHVALEHAGADAAEVAQDPLQQRGLARAGRAHQVRDGHARAVEVVAVGARDRVVGVERVLDDPRPGRGASTSTAASGSAGSPAASRGRDAPTAATSASDHDDRVPHHSSFRRTSSSSFSAGRSAACTGCAELGELLHAGRLAPEHERARQLAAERLRQRQHGHGVHRVGVDVERQLRRGRARSRRASRGPRRAASRPGRPRRRSPRARRRDPCRGCRSRRRRRRRRRTRVASAHPNPSSPRKTLPIPATSTRSGTTSAGEKKKRWPRSPRSRPGSSSTSTPTNTRPSMSVSTTSTTAVLPASARSNTSPPARGRSFTRVPTGIPTASTAAPRSGSRCARGSPACAGPPASPPSPGRSARGC